MAKVSMNHMFTHQLDLVDVACLVTALKLYRDSIDEVTPEQFPTIKEVRQHALMLEERLLGRIPHTLIDEDFVAVMDEYEAATKVG